MLKPIYTYEMNRHGNGIRDGWLDASGPETWFATHHLSILDICYSAVKADLKC
jgi:hypothetical protein